MKSKYCFFWMSLCVLFLSSCNGSGDGNGVPFTGTILDNITGDWQVTRAQYTTLNANPVQVTEVIAMGATGTMVITDDRRFTLIITPPGENPQIETGQFGVSNNMLTVVFDSDPGNTVFWSIQSSTNTMFLVGPINYDFENDGTKEEATVELGLVKI